MVKRPAATDIDIPCHFCSLFRNDLESTTAGGTLLLAHRSEYLPVPFNDCATLQPGFPVRSDRGLAKTRRRFNNNDNLPTAVRRHAETRAGMARAGC